MSETNFFLSVFFCKFTRHASVLLSPLISLFSFCRHTWVPRQARLSRCAVSIRWRGWGRHLSLNAEQMDVNLVFIVKRLPLSKLQALARPFMQTTAWWSQLANVWCADFCCRQLFYFMEGCLTHSIFHFPHSFVGCPRFFVHRRKARKPVVLLAHTKLSCCSRIFFLY